MKDVTLTGTLSRNGDVEHISFNELQRRVNRNFKDNMSGLNK